MKESIEWIIEYKSPNERKYSKNFYGFGNKNLAFKIAKECKKKSPELGVRIIEQKRKILKTIR